MCCRSEGLRSALLACALSCNAVALGCGASSGARAKTATEVSLATLYPLLPGSAWSYDVDSGDGQTLLATTRVARVQDGAVEVTSGQAVLRYQLRADGIERAGQQGYLLKAPFALDASWPSGPDTVARIVGLHQQLATAAGSFEECVVVQENNASSGQRITTTYCPGVGPARVVSEMEVRGHGLRVIATLRGYAADSSL
jgi:hypothetical protein